jgi:hypothetical protein
MKGDKKSSLYRFKDELEPSKGGKGKEDDKVGMDGKGTTSLI